MCEEKRIDLFSLNENDHAYLSRLLLEYSPEERQRGIQPRRSIHNHDLSQYVEYYCSHAIKQIDAYCHDKNYYQVICETNTPDYFYALIKDHASQTFHLSQIHLINIYQLTSETEHALRTLLQQTPQQTKYSRQKVFPINIGNELIYFMLSHSLAPVKTISLIDEPATAFHIAVNRSLLTTEENNRLLYLGNRPIEETSKRYSCKTKASLDQLRLTPEGMVIEPKKAINKTYTFFNKVEDKLSLLNEPSNMQATYGDQPVCEAMQNRTYQSRHTKFNFYQEYFPGTELLFVAKRQTMGGFRPTLLPVRIAQLIDFTHYLVQMENMGIVHRDINHGNIKISNAKKKLFVLDFEFAIKLGKPGVCCGSIWTMPPELFADEVITDTKSDIYSSTYICALLLGGNMTDILKYKEKQANQEGVRKFKRYRDAAHAPYCFDTVLDFAPAEVRLPVINMLEQMAALDVTTRPTAIEVQAFFKQQAPGLKQLVVEQNKTPSVGIPS